ncbi:metal-sulfur cluster assembly factor [Thermococcus sp. MAR1]|uniref:metal-sulfur cluster assembly factor n=1 Tax=Thermococcus sp. MAR1 TaxID=1638263 RepID=UPI001438EC79|nr:metal-sulfur cluster assembly factor [Thermococcus sp. MAR1]NJE09356.1 metal-sulfur cluster assembly factor [Thermococcus sp. MAR1]
MVTEVDVLARMKELIDEDLVKTVEVKEDGTLFIELSKEIDDTTLIKLQTELGNMDGIKAIEIKQPKKKEAPVENVELTKEMILEKLKEVIDPEIGIDVVNLGLIYELDIRPDNTVYIKMTMTTPGCPLTMWILRAVEDKVLEIPGVKDAEIELTFDPPWTPDRISPEYKKRLGLY